MLQTGIFDEACAKGSIGNVHLMNDLRNSNIVIWNWKTNYVAINHKNLQVITSNLCWMLMFNVSIADLTIVRHLRSIQKTRSS